MERRGAPAHPRLPVLEGAGGFPSGVNAVPGSPNPAQTPLAPGWRGHGPGEVGKEEVFWGGSGCGSPGSSAEAPARESEPSNVCLELFWSGAGLGHVHPRSLRAGRGAGRAPSRAGGGICALAPPQPSSCSPPREQPPHLGPPLPSAAPPDPGGGPALGRGGFKPGLKPRLRCRVAAPDHLRVPPRGAGHQQDQQQLRRGVHPAAQ